MERDRSNDADKPRHPGSQNPVILALLTGHLRSPVAVPLRARPLCVSLIDSYQERWSDLVYLGI